LIIQRKCLIVLTEGRRRFGNIRTDDAGNAVIRLENGEVEKYPLSEVIALQEVDDKFWQRFKGAIDLGYNLTKANNNRQFTIGGKLEYTGEIWLIEGSINTLNSNQDDADKTKRTDANLELIRLLPREWYLLGEVSFLSNTEQALDARFSPSLGLGKLLISTNKLYLGLTIGLTYNIENYADSSLNKTSSEAFIGASFKMFDFKDIDLDTGLKFYPSLSEKGRRRTDYDLTLKYDLPLDFYIKMGFTFNYDNQPAIMGNDFDYIFTSGFGWDFD
jgi:putative salt-induced outer membrane protein YdiY